MSLAHGADRRYAPASLRVAVGATCLGLAMGYALKVQCALHPWADAFQYRRLCYNDIQPLFGVRGISDGLLPYRDVIVEYPVLTGTFMYLCGLILTGLVRLGWLANASDGAYLGVTALLLAPFALAVTLVLRRRVTRLRLMIWAVGTPLILYAFHNWDLIAVAAGTWGLVAGERERNRTAGTALATGASAKLYPAFFAPSLLLARWARRDRKGATHFVLFFLATYLVLNVPWILISNPDPPAEVLARSQELGHVSLREPGENGWLEVWRFHGERYPDFGTFWYWVGRWGSKVHPASFWDPGQPGYRDLVSLSSLGLFTLGSGALLLHGWRRRTEPQAYPAVAVSLGIVCLFLLTSKVHSPQYALWVVPLLAMLNIPWRHVILYLATDLAVYISGFYYFTVMDAPSPAWQGAFQLFVWARVGALGVLLWASLRADTLEPAIPDKPAETPPTPVLQISSRPG